MLSVLHVGVDIATFYILECGTLQLCIVLKCALNYKWLRNTDLDKSVKITIFK